MVVEGASEAEGAAPELSRSLMKRLWLGSGLRPSGGTDSSQAPRVVQLLGRDTCHERCCQCCLLLEALDLSLTSHKAVPRRGGGRGEIMIERDKCPRVQVWPS